MESKGDYFTHRRDCIFINKARLTEPRDQVYINVRIWRFASAKLPDVRQRRPYLRADARFELHRDVSDTCREVTDPNPKV